MSGHSKWAGIKHKKAAQDAKRGRIFTKLIRELTVAAREGGGNPDINARLRTAIDRAREANMPMDNIDKAIKRGTGDLPGVSYEACLFEGYGPGGVAVLVEALTDNKNRTTAEVRNIFSKRGGNMAGSGSVAWIFTKKGYVLIEKSQISEDDLFAVSVDAGADDVKTEGKNFEVYCDPQDFETVKGALKEKNVSWEMADLTMLPNSTVQVSGVQNVKQLLALIEHLEDHDDVQKVYANFDVPDDILEEVAQEMSR